MRERPSPVQRLRGLDWDAVAAVVAAIVALVLHLLHVVDVGVLLAIILAVLALMVIRDLRREMREEEVAETLVHTLTAVARIQTALTPPDVVLIGPPRLRAESERFARQARGEMVWFNVCLSMFVPQSLFDVLLRPAIENPRVTAIQFILDRGEQSRWHDVVLPKVSACGGRDKVREPLWRELHESISFILAETGSGDLEAHVSFWGEPFMSRATGHDMPRYIFHVQRHSELIGRLVEIQRLYRLE